MVIDARKRAVEKLAYIFYLKRKQRNQFGNSLMDYMRAEHVVDYLKKRIGLFERIMK